MPRMMMRFERTVMPISGLRGWWIVPLLSLVNLAGHDPIQWTVSLS